MKSPKFLIVIVVLVAVGAGFWWYWGYSAAHPSTDDSYLQAHVVDVAAQVSGTVESVEVNENQFVQAGDVLFTLDPARLNAARDAAQAQLDLAMQGSGSADAGVAQAEANLAQAVAAQTEAQTGFDRQLSLFKLGDVAQAALDQASTALESAKAGVAAAQAGVVSATAAAGDGAGGTAQVRAALAQLEIATLDLSHGVVKAPASGWIANISMRPGQYVAAGSPQFALVEDQDWWVDANFKETDLARIRPGQPVTLEVDMYPGLELKGTVASIGSGSGATFSLLPAQNATGNWVKVTQRFPVRIDLIERPTDPALQLRVGASVSAMVDTTVGVQ